MQEAPTDLAARYPRPGFPGAVWLRSHPPFRGGRLAVLGWAGGLAAAEVVASLSARSLFGFALLDVALVPAGLVAGCWGLAVRHRRRAAAVERVRGLEVADVEAPPAADLRGAAQQWDLLVHGALLVNLVLFGGLLLLSTAVGTDDAFLLFGPVLVASALIPVSVGATWCTARAATTDGEALASAVGVGRPAAVRRARWLVRVALAPHIVLGVATVVAFATSMI